MQQIYKITLENLQKNKHSIINNMTNDYYWSDEWNLDLYVELAKIGFICTTYDTKDGLVLLPEIQFEYAILDFHNLHVSKKVKKLLKKGDVSLPYCPVND